MFELEGPDLTVRRFEFDLGVSASVNEPDIRRSGPIRKTAGLPTLKVEPRDSGQKFTDCIFDFCFRSHKKISPPLLYFRANALYNIFEVRAGR